MAWQVMTSVQAQFDSAYKALRKHVVQGTITLPTALRLLHQAVDNAVITQTLLRLKSKQWGKRVERSLDELRKLDALEKARDEKLGIKEDE
jgi:hypothetical protein